MKKWFTPWQCFTTLAVMLLVVVDVAFAQGSSVAGTYTGCGEGTLFSPPCSDKSIEYLSKVFGAVGGVLTGVEGTMIQEMFSVFNAAVLGLGSIVIMYTLFLGTIKTAHEGELLGQKWSSVWIPIKSALGIIMIVPAKASGGYSFIQVFFMWVIIQGVGAADTLWETILQSLADEKPVIAQPMMMGSNLAFKEAFLAMTCMYALNKVEEPEAPPSYAPVTVGDTTFFRAGPYGDACGFVKVAEGGDVTGAAPQAALQESLSILQNAAMSVAYEEEADWPSGAISEAIAAYAGAMTSKVSQFKKNDGAKAQMNAAMARARDLGWIFAGSYYYDIARIQDRISVQVFQVPTATRTYLTKLPNETFFAPPQPEDKKNNFDVIMRKAGDYINKNPVQATARQFASENKAGSFSDAEGLGRTSMGGQFSEATGISKEGINIPEAAGPSKLTDEDPTSPVREVTDFLYGSFNDLLAFFQEHMSGEDPDTGQQINPMFAMQTFGTYILAVVELLWLSITIILAALAIVGAAGGLIAAVPFVGMGASQAIIAFFLGLGNMLMWVISFIGPILMFMFMIGGILAHYVPLIPFLLFTFGAIGWLMLCFETMVAAPIVALGILHPEGEIWGKAEPAIMLLTNVFITPSLLLFGLIGAMMLSYVVVSMVNFGFYNAIIAFTGINETSVTGQIVVAISSITGFVAFITVYMGTIMFAVEKCFSLIPELRTKVLTWIGGQAAGFGEEKALGEVKGKVEGGQKAMGETQAKVPEGSKKVLGAGASGAFKGAKKSFGFSKGGGGGGGNV